MGFAPCCRYARWWMGAARSAPAATAPPLLDDPAEDVEQNGVAEDNGPDLDVDVTDVATVIPAVQAHVGERDAGITRRVRAVPGDPAGERAVLDLAATDHVRE